MFNRIARRLRRQERRLWALLVLELKDNKGVMERRELVERFETKYSRRQVQMTIDLLIQTGVVAQEEQIWSNGHGIYPSQTLTLSPLWPHELAV